MKTDETFTRNLIRMGAPHLDQPYFYRILPTRGEKWIVELRSWKGKFRSYHHGTSSETIPYPGEAQLIAACKEVHDDYFS